MPKIIVIDHDQQEHEVEYNEGDVLLDVLDDNGIFVRTDCGGLCACVTCHVYTSYPKREQLNKPDEDEQVMLSQVEGHTPNSRLSCEVLLNKAVDGMKVELAPGSELLEEQE